MKKNNPLQHFDIDKEKRSKLKSQRPRVIWLTGISGAGKSTIANALDKKLHTMGRHSYVLDGDNVRNGLSKDLAFSDCDRNENVRRVSEVAALMVDAGLIVIVALISPIRKKRQEIRDMFDPGEFLEIFVSTTLKDAESRDVKGFYKRARQGLVENFTGIDSTYEAPSNPELIIDTSSYNIDQSVKEILGLLDLGSVNDE